MLIKNLPRKELEIGCVQEHGSLGRSSWGQWQRRRCRQEQRCRWSQHPIPRPCCSQQPARLLPHRTYCRAKTETPSPSPHRRLHPGTELSCTWEPSPATPSSPRTAQRSPPGLCVLLRTLQIDNHSLMILLKPEMRPFFQTGRP